MSRRDPEPTADPSDAPSTARHAYSLPQLQQLIGLGRSTILSLVAAGYVSPARGPRRQYRFSFQDAVLLRSAHRLQQAHIPRRRLLAALRQLRARLPAQLPLSGLRIQAIGDEVAVRTRGVAWQTPGGQLLMDFEVVGNPASADAAPAPLVFLEPAPGVALHGPSEPDAAALFAAAAAAEPGDRGAAEALYRELLRVDPTHESGYINLGALLCDAGRCAEAVALYELAATAELDSALLRFNTAVALDGLGDDPAALDAYRRTLTLDPRFADAHFNAAAACERLGDARGALRHYSAYRRLAGAGAATPGA